MNMQTPSQDKQTQTPRREPLRWLAVAAVLLAFFSICCVAQVVTYLLTPRDAQSSLALLSKNQADYKPWGDGPQIPALAPQVPAAQAAERATSTVVAAQPTPASALPTAELAIVPPGINAPTPTSADVLLFQPTPTSTPRSVAGGAPSNVPTRVATAVPPTATPPASDTPTRVILPTDTPTDTPIPPTPIPPTATRAPQPTRQPTPVPPTDTPQPQPTDTPQPQPTDTPRPQPTSTPQPQPTSTSRPRPTNTPQPQPTSTPQPTIMPTTGPSDTPTTAPIPSDTPTIAPTATNTPIPTPTPTVGGVSVSKSVSPTSGGDRTNATFRVVVTNNTGGPIVLTRIDDDMSSLTAFKGASCVGPDGNPCGVPPGNGGVWSWSGSVTMKDGDSVTMLMGGQFRRFPPIGPGTPTPAPQQYCNPRATATYNGGQVSSGRACFTLR